MKHDGAQTVETEMKHEFADRQQRGAEREVRDFLTSRA